MIYDVKANWKLVIQNYSECLHCPIIHPALQKLSHYMTGDNDPPTSTWLGGRMELRPEIGTMSRDGRLRARLPAGPERRASSAMSTTTRVLPNLLLSLHPDYVMSHVLWPKSPDRTEIWCEWHFHPKELANPAFDPADVIDFWDDTNREDWRVSELSQQGIGVARLPSRLLLAARGAALGVRPGHRPGAGRLTTSSGSAGFAAEISRFRPNGDPRLDSGVTTA